MDDSDDMFGDLPGGERKAADSGAAELEAAGQNAMFAAPSPAPAEQSPPEAPAAPAIEAAAPPVHAAPVTEAVQPYRVLARKYRPQTFSELIGQEPMVRTLANAIARERLAHAFLMTGVRGVGKTSTARLIAKALNCVGPDGQGGPTIDPCGQCEPCRAIAEGRHIDVIEMDAASHTGVDDVREIVEAVRYAAVSARYKIYIIDEVHMLSRNAFNALLKTLEEPPAHVKFLFATTEVDKLPVTVLSRTQRFDLRRIPTALLEQHFASICRQEGVEAEAEAIALIASAAEGSVRDGLSILDQAIAHADLESGGDEGDAGGGQARVTAARVRDMLGLADKGAQRRLFGALLEGNPQAMLEAVDRQYALGVEPLALLRAAMDLTHRVALAQTGRGEADAPMQEEREAIGQWARDMSPGQVHRLWQLLLKGYDEVRGAPDPLAALQMALLRALHAADLPDPGALAQTMREMAASGAASGVAAGAETPGHGAETAPDWKSLVERIDQSGAMHLASRLRLQVCVIELAPGRLLYRQEDGFDDDLRPELRAALMAVTDRRWTVEIAEGEGTPALAAQEQAAKDAEAAEIRGHDLVKAAFAAFPGAEILTEDHDQPRPGDGRHWNKQP